MLVLSRQRDESVICRIPPGTVIPPEGLELKVAVVDIRGDKVRLGLSAPKDTVSIHRAEVQTRIDCGQAARIGRTNREIED